MLTGVVRPRSSTYSKSIRDFLTEGNTTVQSFPASTLTAWDKRREQTFELGIKGNTGFYCYRLVVEHDLATLKNRIRSEELQFNEKLLYQFDGKDAHLFRDNGTAGPVFPLDWSRSGIPTVPPRSDNSLLTWFRDRLKRIYIFSPDPVRMTSHSDAEVHASRSSIASRGLLAASSYPRNPRTFSRELSVP